MAERSLELDSIELAAAIFGSGDQNIHLLEAHPPLLGVDTHPACGFMQDLAFHGLLFGFL